MEDKIRHNDDNILIGKDGEQLYWMHYNNNQIEVYKNFPRNGNSERNDSLVIFDKCEQGKNRYIGPIESRHKLEQYYLNGPANSNCIITYNGEYALFLRTIKEETYEIGGLTCFVFTYPGGGNDEHSICIISAAENMGLIYPELITKSGDIIVMKSDIAIYKQYNIYKVKHDENELNWDNWVDIEKLVYEAFSRDKGEERFLVGLGEIILEADALKIDNIGEKYSGEIDQLKDEVSYYILSKLLEKEITDDNILDEVIGDGILLKTIIFNEAGKVVNDYIANSSYWLGV